MLCSWLNPFRRRARRRPEGRLDGTGNTNAPHGTGTGAAPTATQLSTGGDAIENRGGPAGPTASSENGSVEGSCADPESKESASGAGDKIRQCDPAAAPVGMKSTAADSVRKQSSNAGDDPTGEGPPVDDLSAPEYANSDPTYEPQPALHGAPPARVPAGETAGPHPVVAPPQADRRDNDDSADGGRKAQFADPVDVEAANSESEESRPCPRCGITCRPDQVERVFGFRTVSWMAAGRQTTATHRQSYCRKCRAAHASGTPGRSRRDVQFAEPENGASAASDVQRPDAGSVPVSPDAETIPIHEQSPAGEIASTEVIDAAPNAQLDDNPSDDGQKSTDTVSGGIATLSDAGDGGREQPAAASDQIVAPPSERDFSATEHGAGDGAGPAAVEPPTESPGRDPNDRNDTPPAESEDGKVEGGPGATRTAARDAKTVPPPHDPTRPPARSRQTEGRRPSQYRAPAGGPPPRSRPLPSSTPHHHSRNSRAQHSPVHIEVRIVFQRGGYCSVSLLPRRLPDFPAELLVVAEGNDVELLALQEDWYQDVAPDDLAELLRKGVIWRNLDTGQEWILSGRQVFVLAHGTTHRGFVSCARLSLGRNHVVLCTVAKLGPVEDALREAGCSSWTQLGEEDGAPRGWLVLKEVVPQKAVLPSEDADILNVLRPLPEIDIALEGGIRLAYNSWLLGYPPAIRVYGDPEHTKTVLVDGREATVSSRNRYTVLGWDTEGDHSVWCSSSSRSYSLVPCNATWARWPAYTLDVSSSPRYIHRVEFCGPLVRPVVAHDRLESPRVVQVHAANPVLLGARPGEVFFARPRLDIRGAECLATPPFDPVWAMPAQPLRCDKRRSRVLLVEQPRTQNSSASQASVSDRRDLELWCLWILDASRKGLPVQPASPEAESLWKDHRQLARTLWRTLR